MDWSRLERLRDLFLRGDKSVNYWRDHEDLEAYDAVFARRIGWKWEGVLEDLSARGFRPMSRQVLDWACGTGIASRVFAERFSSEVSHVLVWDRSQEARAFASRGRAVEAKFEAAAADPLFGAESPATRSVVLLSHVINELEGPQLERLLAALGRAAEIIWVEPGSYEESRRLGHARARLLATHEILGPCFHEARCDALTDRNERHWCHSFAPVPAEAFTTPFWTEASQRLGFDLRSLPYSYIALRRRDLALERDTRPDNEGLRHWMLGRPRVSKGFLHVLTCAETGEVEERRLQKRAAPSLFKELQKDKLRTAALWLATQGDEIVGGES